MQSFNFRLGFLFVCRLTSFTHTALVDDQSSLDFGFDRGLPWTSGIIEVAARAYVAK